MLSEATKDWQSACLCCARRDREGTINQALDLGIRHTRYRGIDKTRLHHVLTACAINLIRLDAYWNGRILDRTRASHLGRLEHALAA